MPGIEHILTNPFLNATKRSLSRARVLGSYTDAGLGRPGAPPEIVALYNTYHPVFENFKALFLARDSQTGHHISKTFAQTLLLEELSERIKEWGFQIEYVHRRDSPEYQTFFPQGRRPFRHGKIEMRASAVSQLALALQGKPEFSALLAEVQAFSEQLQAAIAGAIAAQSIKSTSSKELERGRIELCNALYAVLGGLIHLYPDRPHKVSAYFDTATMHRHRTRGKGEEGRTENEK
jgi:hypothetical protein